jgi:putative holliday junction resolvase
LSGREGPAAVGVRAYALALAERVDVPVRLVDERLSTVAAHRSLRAAGVPGRRQRAVVDQVAAVVLLQTALDQERATGAPVGSLIEEV